MILSEIAAIPHGLGADGEFDEEDLLYYWSEEYTVGTIAASKDLPKADCRCT